MAKQVQLRRGTTSQHSTFTGAVGEVTVDTDKDTLVVHDGSTAGGFPLAKIASPTFTGTPTAPTAAVGTNTTQIATTEFAKIAASPARYTRTVLFEGSVGNGDISLSAAWDTFDELIFYCFPDSSDWATVVRFDTQDILAAAVLSGQKRFLLDFREFWTFYPASNKMVIDTGDENSIIKKIIGVKW
jgi:hypothetical protein